jgi:hypothetical protein
MENMLDVNRELMLDGNAAAGILQEIFGVEMTAAETECAHCGNEGEMGALLVFMRGPGIVLCCSACEKVMIRVVQAPGGIYLDARGAAFLHIRR